MRHSIFSRKDSIVCFQKDGCGRSAAYLASRPLPASFQHHLLGGPVRLDIATARRAHPDPGQAGGILLQVERQGGFDSSQHGLRSITSAADLAGDKVEGDCIGLRLRNI
jgi:hypothetical protein